MQKGTSWVTVLGGAFSFGDNGVILHIHAFNLILSQIVKKYLFSFAQYKSGNNRTFPLLPPLYLLPPTTY